MVAAAAQIISEKTAHTTKAKNMDPEAVEARRQLADMKNQLRQMTERKKELEEKLRTIAQQPQPQRQQPYQPRGRGYGCGGYRGAWRRNGEIRQEFCNQDYCTQKRQDRSRSPEKGFFMKAVGTDEDIANPEFAGWAKCRIA